MSHACRKHKRSSTRSRRSRREAASTLPAFTKSGEDWKAQRFIITKCCSKIRARSTRILRGRALIRLGSGKRRTKGMQQTSRLPICDTAECHSALREGTQTTKVGDKVFELLWRSAIRHLVVYGFVIFLCGCAGYRLGSTT